VGTVYFVNGFLEAGKTTFIKEFINKEAFRIKGETLILLCEEGDREYDEKELEDTNSKVELIADEKDFNEHHLARLENDHEPERIIVEFNGMWDRKSLAFPWYWDDIMEIAVFDASTFKLYSDNLRALLAEQVRNAELVVFYKADEVRDQLASFVRNIKAINGAAAFLFKGAEGDFVLEPDEYLPYDVTKDEIFLDDTGFVTMCIDSLERPEVYAGKKAHFMARVYKMREGGELEFIAGRRVMTCCEADLSFMGIICGYPKAYELQDREWVEITGVLRVRYDEMTKTDIVVCRVTELQNAEAPQEEILTLT